VAEYLLKIGRTLDGIHNHNKKPKIHEHTFPTSRTEAGTIWQALQACHGGALVWPSIGMHQCFSARIATACSKGC
jgi:hypothetical protein